MPATMDAWKLYEVAEMFFRSKDYDDLSPVISLVPLLARSVFRSKPQAINCRSPFQTWGFPKIRGTVLGGPRIRMIVYWCPFLLGTYQIVKNMRQVVDSWSLICPLAFLFAKPGSDTIVVFDKEPPARIMFSFLSRVRQTRRLHHFLLDFRCAAME